MLVFGLSALVGIWITAVLIDRALRPLALVSVAVFVVIAVALALAVGSVPVTVCAIVGWGVAFGGAATQLQTASANAAGEAADVANAMLTTVFNLAIFAAGASGALIVDGVGARAIPATMGILSLAALVIVAYAHRYAFPRS